MAPLPLSEFPPAERERILELASRPTAPPRWLSCAGGISQITSRAWWEWRRRRRADQKRIKRLRIAERDNWRCGLCGLPIDAVDLHIDHVHPRCKGGTSDPANLQATHRICNQRKGGR